jgi:hypothetical protein
MYYKSSLSLKCETLKIYTQNYKKTVSKLKVVCRSSKIRRLFKFSSLFMFLYRMCGEFYIQLVRPKFDFLPPVKFCAKSRAL